MKRFNRPTKHLLHSFFYHDFILLFRLHAKKGFLFSEAQEKPQEIINKPMSGGAFLEKSCLTTQDNQPSMDQWGNPLSDGTQIATTGLGMMRYEKQGNSGFTSESYH